MRNRVKRIVHCTHKKTLLRKNKTEEEAYAQLQIHTAINSFNNYMQQFVYIFYIKN